MKFADYLAAIATFVGIALIPFLFRLAAEIL